MDLILESDNDVTEKSGLHSKMGGFNLRATANGVQGNLGLHSKMGGFNPSTHIKGIKTHPSLHSKMGGFNQTENMSKELSAITFTFQDGWI